MIALWYLIFSSLVVVGVSGVVSPNGVRGEELPCTAEIRSFCADVQPGQGRIIQCLRQHEAQLSPACMKRIDDLLVTADTPWGRACRDDWAAFCYHPRASTERQEMLQCLQANRAKVSAGCKKALDDATATRPQRRNVAH